MIHGAPALWQSPPRRSGRMQAYYRHQENWKMYWKRLSALAAALALTGAFAGQALAQRDEESDRSRWIEIGKRKVNMSNEKDVIKVGQGEAWWNERGFRRLYLVA